MSGDPNLRLPLIVLIRNLVVCYARTASVIDEDVRSTGMILKGKNGSFVS
jgi:hypothetical protein